MSISRKDYIKTSHQFLNVGYIMSAHILIIFLFYAFHKVNFTIYFTTIISMLCSVIHQKYMSEWVHESAHFNILINKKINDLFTNIFISAIFGSNIAEHRHSHFIHHKLTEFFNENDPDTGLLMVKTKRQLKLSLLQDILGITALKMILFKKTKVNKPIIKRNLNILFYVYLFCFHATIIYVLYIKGLWHYYVIYYTTLGTIYPVVNRIRVYGQHIEINKNGIGSLDASTTSRTIKGGIFDKIFFTSDLMAYHNEHHKRSSIPYRGLHKMCYHKFDIKTFTRSRWPIISSLYKGLI